jgi:hypothetical protein
LDPETVGFSAWIEGASEFIFYWLERMKAKEVLSND